MWAEKENDWVQILIRHPPRKEGATPSLRTMMRQPTAHLKKKGGGTPSKKPGELSPMELEPSTTVEEVEIRGDSKTVVDSINGHVKQKKTTISTIAAAQIQNEGLVGHEYRRCRLGGAHFPRPQQ